MTASWKGGFEFKIDFPAGESLTLTSVPLEKRPGPGPSPMEAVQAAVAGCTGMDVVLILGKMRKTLDSFRVEVEAERRREHPRIFTGMELTYHLSGPDLDADSVTRAVRLSQEKYCSVTSMLRPPVEMTYRIVLNDRPLAAD
jgi:putative redox protein